MESADNPDSKISKKIWQIPADNPTVTATKDNYTGSVHEKGYGRQ